jgi:hypothetical protein
MRTDRRFRLARPVGVATALALVLGALGMPAARAQADPAAKDGRPPREKPKVGVLLNEPRAFQGYTLLFPLQSTKTYLLDMQGRVVRTWESKYTAGQDAYLLENGHLLRAAKLNDNEAFFAGAGSGGRVQEFTWEGQLIWDFKFHNDKQIQHHAITRMPNGNVLLLVWERKTPQEVIDAGLKPEWAKGDVLVDAVVEVQPAGKTGGRVVWEWHVWDHLVQDHDKNKANYGDVAAHPELIDVNFGRESASPFGNLARFVPPPQPKKDDTKKPDGKNDSLDKLKGIGYVGAGGGRRFQGFLPDWTHVNGVSYNPRLDQVMLSTREFSEVWIIDHGTTKAEAAGHVGGRGGKGGDLLYRWGNPRAYRAGTAADQRLFTQHDAHWIPEGLPGAGHMLVFSNGARPDGNYSSVDEVVLPVDAEGRYAHEPGTAFGPDKPAWSYTAPKKTDFFAPLMSGAQRLPNGNTLVCTGFSGTIFEVTPDKETVWKYVAPADSRPGPGGFGPPRGPGGPGFPGGFAAPDRSVQLFPGPLSFFLQLTPEQRKQLEEFEKEASGKLDAMLTDEQRKQLKEAQKNPQPPGPGGPPPELARVLGASVQDKLKLTADQKKQVAELQKEANGTLDKVLKEEQKKQIKDFKEMMRRVFAGGGPPRFGPGGPGGFGPPGGSPLFRAYRYGTDYPGLAGKELKPGKTVEELQPKPPERK